MTDNQILTFKKPGCYIPAPLPLKEKLMNQLDLNGEMGIVAFREHDIRNTTVQAPAAATPSLAKELMRSKVWVEVLLTGGKLAWWWPSKKTTQWHKPQRFVEGMKVSSLKCYYVLVLAESCRNRLIEKWWAMARLFAGTIPKPTKSSRQNHQV
jgi:hypothetical protein